MFTDQLDEVKLLKGRLANLNDSDPFENTRRSKHVDSHMKASEEHFRMLRLGHDMIDNVFGQMHELINKAKAQLKD